MDYSRQQGAFKQDVFNTPVHVIGAGATGSWVVLMLAKMGVKDITVHDFDTVGDHNIPNQLYGVRDIGQSKVHALAKEVRILAGISIKVSNKEVTEDTQLNGIVFMLTDTMRSRNHIWRGAIKNKVGVNLLIETRMGLDVGRIYTVNPMKPEDVKRYEATLYTDEESAVSVCGTSQSIITTATRIAAMAVTQMINYTNDKENDLEIIVDTMNHVVYKGGNNA